MQQGKHTVTDDFIPLHNGLGKEFKTVTAMIDIYCRAHHRTSTTCTECESLKHYANVRLDRCPYGESKPTCNRCPIHCYKQKEKAMMKAIMRFSGPRMLLHHPLLAIRHLIHERRKEVPAKPPKHRSNRYIRLQQQD
ncbi:nitrous oxide-stimulated promoter family protein [Thaumasiovibrio subtropicus]|uniref:nitrous oxide-stimulated promoter family protein n=1 Tax=Thaumasiovibrio subtropicus TaxID=1891207 RepID=UPI000B35DE2D|nr:nitrous oxide-stimulated promoter family protein [Thaumasiovibrio subtropicus]